MKTVEELAREAGDDWDSTQQRDKDFLERFAALYREALIAEMVAGSGEPSVHSGEVMGEIRFTMDHYTADQLAGAVLRERERLTEKQEPVKAIRVATPAGERWLKPMDELYLHPAPAVNQQLLGALRSLADWFDAPAGAGSADRHIKKARAAIAAADGKV